NSPLALTATPAFPVGPPNPALAASWVRTVRDGRGIELGLAVPPENEGTTGGGAKTVGPGTESGGGGAPLGLGPSLSNVSVMTVPELLILTLPAFSSISKTSTSLSRCPTERMSDWGLAGSGGLAGNWSVISARVLPIVKMPFSVIFGTIGAG